jgi:hypothetical protein
MSEVDRILDLASRAYAGESWHGPAVREVLTGVDAASALQRPSGLAHSIWELVLHMTVWKDEVTRRLGGAAPRTLSAADDWPSPAGDDEGSWRAALADLDVAHDRLCAAIGRLGHDQLDGRLGGDHGTWWTVYTTVHGVVHHDLYHAGQVALVKRLVRDSAAQGPA